MSERAWRALLTYTYTVVHVPACVTPVNCAPVWMRAHVCADVSVCARAPAATWVCVCVCVWSSSYQILLKAWFPLGNDRGHLIGEGWKQHLHPIGHTHDIKVLARQKHVKEIYIAALTALQTGGHSPLPLPIIKATFIVCVNSIFSITNKNIMGRGYFFLCHRHYHPLHPLSVYQAANQN